MEHSVQSPPSHRQDQEILSSHAVQFIIQGRVIATSKLINVQGVVTAVSEIFRVKKDTIFCIQLDYKVNLLVKNPEKLHWHGILQVKQKYLFTLLKLTTLSKGAACERKVLVPSQKSVLSPAGEDLKLVDFKEQVSPFRFQDVPNKQAGDTDENRKDRNEADHIKMQECHITETDQRHHLTSYEGIITDNSLSSIGVFVLDGKVGLYLCCMPSVDMVEELRLDTKIVLHNVHMKGTVQEPKLRMICCTVSSVQIIRPSPTKPKPRALGLPECVRQLYVQHGCNIRELLNVMEAMQALIVKFGGIHHSMKLIQDILAAIPKERKTSRNLLEEFMSVPHECCLTKEKENPIVVPSVVPLSEITSFSDSVIQNLFSAGRENLSKCQDGNKLSTAVYWLCHREKTDLSHNKALVGILYLCPKSGKLKVKDRTGSLYLLPVPSSKDSKGDKTSERKFLPFHILHSKTEPLVVCLQKYSVVYEQFQVCDIQNACQFGNVDLVKVHREIVYVQCSLSDLKIMNSGVKCNQDSSQWRNTFTELIYVLHKESLMMDGTNSSTSRLRFIIKGYSLGQIHHVDDIQKLICTESSHFTTLKNKNCNVPKDNQCKSSRPSPKPQLRIFKFEGEAAKWYSAIEENAYYMFSSDKELSAVRLKQYSTQLRRVIERADGKGCVQIPEDVLLEHVECRKHGRKCRCQVVTELEINDSLVSIEEILSLEFTETFVSFEGRVVGRNHSDLRASAVISESLQDAMDHHCIGTLDNHQIILTVCDPHGTAQIQVILSLQNMAYPLGLHPQATVLFKRLERKQKKGRVFCQYVCISSIQILDCDSGIKPTPEAGIKSTPSQGSEQGTKLKRVTTTSREEILINDGLGRKPLHCQKPQSETEQLSLVSTGVSADDTRFRYLSDALRSSEVCFRSMAHIQRILKLSLKCVCVGCNGVITHETCSNSICREKETSQFVARASITIDDGTGSAMLSLYGEVVKFLLGLDDQQWASLRHEIIQSGEIFIDEGSSPHHPIEIFLSLLCNSNIVRRQCVMVLQQANVRRIQTLATDSKLEDYPLKTVDVGVEDFRTRYPPLPQYQCQSLREVDCKDRILHYLSQHQKM